MKAKLVHLVLLPAWLMVCAGALEAGEVTVSVPDSPMVRFALGKLEAVLARQGDGLKRTAEAGAGIVVRVEAAAVGRTGKEGFERVRVGQGLRITAGDERGAMYGLLDVAQEIGGGTRLERIAGRTARARMEFRAIKFNLPWSAYRTSAALEQHQETCKDLRYWEAFLDMMAENRFNVLTLWSLHPFHYMVRPKNFPEATPFNEAEMAEWKKLWSGIFAMAKERGIETYLVQWNIFVSPELARARNVAPWSVDGSHIRRGAEPSDLSLAGEVVDQYTREVVTQVLDEYPDLTGLGITLGERMGGMTPDERRAWLDKTVLAGIAQAKRPAKFIYRAPLSAGVESGGTTSEENDRRSRARVERLTEDAKANITGPVYVEFKHNWSHAYSSPELFIVHGGKLSDAYWNPAPAGHKVVWTMRNEDMYILRWGQPDFVREFIARQGGEDYVGGALIGSECYIPALDYISKEGPHKTWSWAFQRQWLYYAVWGQLLYDPATPDGRFEGMLDARFGKRTGKDLLAAWKLASKVPLHLASFHRGTWDGALYTEGFSSWVDWGDKARTFFGINEFIGHPVLDTKRYVNIADWVKTGQVPAGAFSPLSLAEQLDRDSAAAKKLVARVRLRGQVSADLDCELTDIEAWGAYSDYFAAKLRGGVALERARATKDTKEQALAVAELETALGHWKRLAELGGRFNQLPVLSNSGEPFSWASLTPAAERDIENARAPLSSGSAAQ